MKQREIPNQTTRTRTSIGNDDSEDEKQHGMTVTTSTNKKTEEEQQPQTEQGYILQSIRDTHRKPICIYT